MPGISMRTHVGALVGIMGLFGLILALVTGEFYRHLIFEHQRESLGRIGAVKGGDLLQQLEERTRDFGLALQNTPEFRRAFVARDEQALNAVLEAQFHRYFVTAGVLKLVSLYAVDEQFRKVAQLETDPDGRSFCPAVKSRAAARSGAERVKPLAALCTEYDHIHHVTVVPIGGLRPIGYLAVVTDPVPELQKIEASVGMPIRLKVQGSIRFTSPSWPLDGAEDPLVAAADLPAEGLAPLTLEFSGGATRLAEELRTARLMVMLLAGAATVALAAAALALFNRCTLQPMRQLTQGMRMVRRDRARLGAQVVPSGNAEMRELAEDFNEFSAELRELHQTLESLAYNDALTGLPNRVLFRDRLEQQIRLAERDRSGFAVLAIDLDRFKEINDTLGHDAGDRLLRELAQRLKRTLRRSDTLGFAAGHTMARLGGDEFCALLPSVTSREHAAVVAEKLLSAVEEEFELEGRRLRIGMSIGLALYPEHAASADQICRCADAAMYSAKRSGTGYALYSPAIQTPAS